MKHFYKLLMSICLAGGWGAEGYSQGYLRLEHSGNTLIVKYKMVGSSLSMSAGVNVQATFFIAWPDNVDVTFGVPETNTTNLPGFPAFTVDDEYTYGGYKYRMFDNSNNLGGAVTYADGTEYELMRVRVSGVGYTSFSLKANQNSGDPWFATFYYAGTNRIPEGSGVQPFYGVGSGLVGDEATMEQINVSLPSILDYVKAIVKDDNTVQLQWRTIQEINADRFVVERSADGITYSEIGSVASRSIDGYSNLPLAYELTDLQPFAGLNYYRVRMVDRGGSSAYTNVVTVKMDARTGRFWRITSGTVSNQLTIQFLKRGDFEIRIVAINGTELHRQAASLMPGGTVIVNSSAWSPGTYIIQVVERNGAHSAEKILKQ